MRRLAAQHKIVETNMRIQEVEEMQAIPGGVEEDSGMVGLAYVLFRMTDEFRTEVVRRALNWRDQASAEIRAALRQAVNQSPITVPGFRNADLAPAPRLLEQVAESSQLRSDLAGAVLRLWAESHEELRVLVASHMESRGFSVPQVNYSENLIRLDTVDSGWDDTLTTFLERYPESNKDDVILMINWTAGVLLTDDEIEDGGPISMEDMLSGIYGALSALPPHAAEWEEAVPEFVQKLTELVEVKERDRSLGAVVDQLLAEIRRQYPQLVAFFQWNARKWSSTNCSPVLGLQILHDVASDLNGLLSQYAPIHERAPVVTEELARSIRRAELVPLIVKAGVDLEEMMESGDDSDDDEPEPACLSPDSPDGGLPENRPVNMPAGQDAGSPAPSSHGALSDVETDGSGGPAFDGFTQVLPCSVEDYLLLRLENQDLEQENDELEKEVQSLKVQLFESRGKEEGFRLALASQGGDADAGDGTPEIETVNAAVGLARERFDRQLLFRFNSESIVEDNPFKWPNRVWKALEWLATDYYESRTGAAKITDLDSSCRSASEMWYKTSQHDTTMTTYRNSYTTKVGGRTIWLREHVGKGGSLDPRRTIRIAFDWDRALQKVVIGYIGRHQRTSAS